MNWKYEPDDVEIVTVSKDDMYPCTLTGVPSTNTALRDIGFNTDRFPQAIEWYSGSDSIEISVTAAPFVSIDGGQTWMGVTAHFSGCGDLTVDDANDHLIAGIQSEVGTTVWNRIPTLKGSQFKYYTYIEGLLSERYLRDRQPGVTPDYRWRFVFKLNETVANFKNRANAYIKLYYFKPNPNRWGKYDGKTDVPVTYAYQGPHYTQSATSYKKLYAIVPALKGVTYEWTSGKDLYAFRYDDAGNREFHYHAPVVLTNNEHAMDMQYPFISSQGITSAYAYPDAIITNCDELEDIGNNKYLIARYTVPEDCQFNYMLLQVGGQLNNSQYNFS